MTDQFLAFPGKLVNGTVNGIYKKVSRKQRPVNQQLLHAVSATSSQYQLRCRQVMPDNINKG